MGRAPASIIERYGTEYYLIRIGQRFEISLVDTLNVNNCVCCTFVTFDAMRYLNRRVAIVAVFNIQWVS